MDKDDELSTRLWLETHASQQNSATVVAGLALKSVPLKNKTLNAIAIKMQESHLTWPVILSTGFAILLHRLSSTDHLDIRLLEGQVSDGLIMSTDKYHLMASEMNASLTVKERFELMNAELTINDEKKNESTTARYAIMRKINAKSSRKKLSQTEVNVVLLCVLNESPNDKIDIHYDSHLLNDDAMKQVASHLNQILLSLCQSSDNDHIALLNILTPDEKKKILTVWCDPYANEIPPSTPPCVHQAVARIAEKDAQRVAVKHQENTLNYGLLETASSHLATHLIARGVNVGDPVCVFMNRTPQLFIVMLAIFKAGAIFVPINPKYPTERIEFLLTDTKTSFILTDVNSQLPAAFQHLAWVVTDALLNQSHENITLPEINAERPAYIIYTSGTTGQPKGVVIHHHHLNNLTAWYQYYFKLTEKDIASQFASQGFDSFFCETIPTLSSGATLTVVDDTIKLTPNLFFEWLKNEAITVCDLPTAYAQFLFTLNWPRDIPLRLIKIGGEAITHIPNTLFHFDIYNTYGPTEATVETTYYQLYDAKTKQYHVKAHHPAPIGKPLAHASVYILDQYLMPTPIGVAGELFIGGAGVSSGYLNRLDLTEKKFIINPFSPTGRDKLYRTGDLVKWLDDGNIEFVGRTDNQIKIRGYRIELSDIENALGQHADVSEVLVMTKENINGEKSLVAYVVPNLDRERYLYQERCLLSEDDINFIEGVTEDISKYGIAISGITEKFNVAQKFKIHVKLPGFNETKILTARLIWQKDNRCGFVFDLSEAEQTMLAKSIDYFIANHNTMELVLSSAAKRSLKRALQVQLPEYMIPSTILNVLEFPLTLNGKIDVKALPKPDLHAKTLEKSYLPPKTDTEKKIAQLWEKILNKSPISLSDNFFDIGGNSLSAAQLSIEINQTFNMPIPANILFELAYIPILAEYIDNHGQQYTKASVTQADIDQDKVLPESILPHHNLSQKTTEPENILLTGAGGFLGIFMLRDLLKNTNAKIHCLIRQGEFETAAKRLSSTASKFALDQDVNLTERRIIAIPSDLNFTNFGLPQAQYQALSEKVDTIFHCGAQVSIMASYQQLRGSNVQGTLEVLKFATTGQDKPIHYISTLSSAYLKDAAGSLVESFPTDQYENLFGGYAVSKWVSEVLLRQIKDKGLPVNIYRSGYIFGDSETGILNLNDALLMLMKGCIQLGVAPDMHERVTILPVNFVSRAINAIALSHGHESNVYHIDHPTGIMWRDLVAWLNQQGYRIQLISLAAWKNKLKSITRDNPLYAFSPYYLALPDDYRSTDVSTKHAADCLAELELPYPVIDDALLKTYLKYLQHVGFFPVSQLQNQSP